MTSKSLSLFKDKHLLSYAIRNVMHHWQIPFHFHDETSLSVAKDGDWQDEVVFVADIKL